MKKLILAPALVLALSVAAISPAAAHTPSGGADCVTGVWAQGSGYESGDTNTLSVSVDRQVRNAEFDNDGYLSIAIPQDGRPHRYTWAVETSNSNPAYDAMGGGTLTCGEPTPPPVVRKAWFHVTQYCNVVRFEGEAGNVTSVDRQKVRPGVFRFVGHAKAGAEFKNGRSVLTKTKHVKRHACGDHS